MMRVQTNLERHEVARIYDFLRIGSNGRSGTHLKVKRVLDGANAIGSPRFSLVVEDASGRGEEGGPE